MRRRGIALVAAMLAAGLVGCEQGGVGTGSKPVAVRIVTAEGSSGPVEGVECGVLQLYALGTWDGDDPYEADVSAAATWTSSDTAVIEVGDGTTRARGEVLARGAGTANVHVQYLNFTATMTFTVLPVVEMRIVPEATHLAPGSVETFALEVRTDDDGGWIAKGATWTILQANAAATVDESGAVQASGGPEDVPFDLEARLSGCDVATKRELRVSPVSHLALEYEQPPAQALPLGLTALIRVMAHFVDGALEPQNLSDQVDVELEDTETGVATFTAYADGIALAGHAEGEDAQLSFRFAPLDLTVLSARYHFADLDQETLRVDPVQLTLQYPDDVQLEALGTFSDGIERTVTRHADWTVSDEAVATITSDSGGAGLLTVTADVDQTVRVEAFTLIDGKNVSAECEVRIVRAP